MYKSSFKKKTVSAFWFRPQNQYFFIKYGYLT